MTQARFSGPAGIALQSCANAVDENAAAKAINADMTLSVAVIDLAPACGVPFGTTARSALPSRSSQSEGW
jgi:hypothetical protein